MEDKIKVKEYIRTKDGIIGQILEEDDIGESGVCIDTTFLDDWGEDSNYVRFEDIKNHNLNKIELVEVGDYVNGREVIKDLKKSKEWYNSKDDFVTCVDYTFSNEEIESIVTKEQFELVKYNF